MKEQLHRKQVTRDLKIRVTYALSAQAKEKIERPYQWLQNHLVRRCAQDSITDIEDVREILSEEVDIHTVPDKSENYTLLRIWYKDILCDEYRALSSDIVHF
ncbi:MAG: hypothetical protein BWX81_00203 [Spirochaetes bacterium ADurb.Bin110]|nr:MAG: hypothetical protein BWX81_00203 [Spirochaetes bacterium ADurb.Bin110]